jgi:UDP-N-acetyl-alpha-D-muramoyl-L-alanyl-L-glutamate epimerase
MSQPSNNVQDLRAMLPLRAGSFHFQAPRFVQGCAELPYLVRSEALENGELQFVERITFPGAPDVSSLSSARQVALQSALQCLHWLAGVSYYKALLPPEIVFEYALSESAAKLAQMVYTHGLAEFAHSNCLTLAPRFSSHTKAPAAPALGLDARALIAIGGGKDSLVTIEAAKRAALPACAVWIGRSDLIAATAQASGLPRLNIKRELATELFALNEQGALNGHIPVTAINSGILSLAAVLYGYRDIVFSNERSADAPTLLSGGLPVNHQWSKSAAFEYAFADLLRSEIGADLHYFSALRPFSELAITKKFAAFDHYDHLFSSCNRNFRILGDKPSSRWCGQCPKCHFVFLALAPFIAKPRLLRIFGRNLLDDIALAPGFDALLEWHAHKPFECVGEAMESRAAMAELAARADWREDALIQRFCKEIQPHIAAAEISHALQPDADALARLPAALRNAL